ncbi:hypothetical protein [Ruminococcus sp. NK3A76]|uniref:hypothetical protein n=1 Tax=Ruminococcus sp. NK3A76 TaxID=877411 RepID=UPI000B08DB08|nr:hypothetical protein [Ruminococcus sp. NK3A76]
MESIAPYIAISTIHTVDLCFSGSAAIGTPVRLLTSCGTTLGNDPSLDIEFMVTTTNSAPEFTDGMTTE